MMPVTLVSNDEFTKSPEEFARLQALNAAYNAKFGFPFVVAVKGLDRAGIIQQFAAIPGSRLLHLHHNKHELTWIRL